MLGYLSESITVNHYENKLGVVAIAQRDDFRLVPFLLFFLLYTLFFCALVRARPVVVRISRTRVLFRKTLGASCSLQSLYRSTAALLLSSVCSMTRTQFVESPDSSSDDTTDNLPVLMSVA